MQHSNETTPVTLSNACSDRQPSTVEDKVSFESTSDKTMTDPVIHKSRILLAAFVDCQKGIQNKLKDILTSPVGIRTKEDSNFLHSLKTYNSSDVMKKKILGECNILADCQDGLFDRYITLCARVFKVIEIEYR